MPTLTIGELVLDPAPEIIIRRSTVPASDGGGIRESWLLSGVLRCESPTELAEASGALEAALSAPELTLTVDGALVRALDPEDSRIPPRCVELKWDNQGPGRHNLQQAWSARIDAVLRVESDPISHLELRVTLEVRAGEPLRSVVEGTATLSAGTTPEQAETLLIPPAPNGWRRVESRLVVHPDSTASFRTVDQQVLQALPTGVSDGQYTVTQSRAASGRLTRITQGSFAGPQALQRARELRPPAHLLLAEEVREDPFSGRVHFKFEALVSPGTTESRRFGESVTIRERQRVVEHVLLSPGMPPHRQQVGPPEITITQEGSAQGGQSHPQPPEPISTEYLIEREVRQVPPPGQPRISPPETHWRYVMRPPG